MVLRDFKFWLSRAINYPLASPDVIQIPLTNMCNLQCRMCSIVNAAAKELSTKAIFDIIDQGRLMGIKEAVLTGGEPFLRKDIFDILSYCKMESMRWVITTNGTLFNSGLAERLVTFGPGHLHFSLEGLEETNDFFRGAGNFRKTIDAIKMVNGLRSQKNTGISIGIACTVMKQNLDDLFALLQYADTLNVDVINFQPVLKDNFNTPDRGNSDFWPSSNQTGVLESTVRKIKEYHGNHINVYEEPDLRLLHKYYLKKLNKSDWKCFGGYKTIFICVGIDGSPLVYTCHGICGDLSKVSLKKAWFSKEARKLREQPKKCKELCLQSCYSRESSSSLPAVFKRLN